MFLLHHLKGGQDMQMSLIFKYKVLILDDNEKYANQLAKELTQLQEQQEFAIEVEAIRTSREFMLRAENDEFDAFIVDFCYRLNKPEDYSDTFQYQGRDLYYNVQFDRFDEYRRRKDVRMFFISNLDRHTLQEYCDYIPVDYQCKLEETCFEIALMVVSYFSGRYDSDRKQYHAEITQSKDLMNRLLDHVPQKSYSNPTSISNSIVIAPNGNLNTNDLILRENPISCTTAPLNMHELESRLSVLEKTAITEISYADYLDMKNSIIKLREEISTPKPQKSIIDKLLKSIQLIKGSAEFTAAVVAVVDFFSKLTLPV